MSLGFLYLEVLLKYIANQQISENQPKWNHSKSTVYVVRKKLYVWYIISLFVHEYRPEAQFVHIILTTWRLPFAQQDGGMMTLRVPNLKPQNTSKAR